MSAESGAAFAGYKQIEKMLGAVAQNHEDVIELDRTELFSPGEDRDIAGQFLELIAGNGNAEVLAGYVFDIVRLVENHGVIFGDDAGQVFAFDGQVGEKQVV